MKKILFVFVAVSAAIVARALDFGDIHNLYLVGDAVKSGWNRDAAPQLTKTPSGIFVWSGHLDAGEMKFLVSRTSWNSVVSAAGVSRLAIDVPMPVAIYEELGSNDDKWIVREPGNYMLKVDLVGRTLTVTTYDIGNATAYAGVSVDGVNHKICETLPAGKYVVSASDGTHTKYLSLLSGNYYRYVDTPEEATLFDVNEQNPYHQVLVNTDDRTVDVASYKPWREMYLVGQFNGWAFTPMELSADDPQEFVWKGEIDVSRGNQIKAEGRAAYSAGVDKYGVHPVAENESMTGMTHAATGTVTDYKWTLPSTACYDIRINPFKLTAAAYNDTTQSGAVENLPSDKTIVGRMYFTIDGRRLSEPSDAGVSICVTCYGDGTAAVTKIAGRIQEDFQRESQIKNLHF